MSRVPVWWSMIPTTMNSAALNAACATSSAQPAASRRGGARAEQHDEQAELADRAEGEEQLEVVLAEGAEPAEDEGAAAARGRAAARGPSANIGANRATRNTPAVTIVAEWR